MQKPTNPAFEANQMFLKHLVKAFGAVRVTFKDEDGVQWAVIGWKNMTWEGGELKEIVNEPKKSERE